MLPKKSIKYKKTFCSRKKLTKDEKLQIKLQYNDLQAHATKILRVLHDFTSCFIQGSRMVLKKVDSKGTPGGCNTCYVMLKLTFLPGLRKIKLTNVLFAF